MAPFAGTWLLVGTRQRMIDGSIRPDPDMGSRPSGYLMFDATAGQMCAVLNNGDRTKWKDASHPTDAEAHAIWNQTVSYCGAWTVDATRGELVYELGVNMSPNLIGSERRRRFTLTGDRLILYPTSLPAGPSRVPGSQEHEVSAESIAHDRPQFVWAAVVRMICQGFEVADRRQDFDNAGVRR